MLGITSRVQCRHFYLLHHQISHSNNGLSFFALAFQMFKTLSILIFLLLIFLFSRFVHRGIFLKRHHFFSLTPLATGSLLLCLLLLSQPFNAFFNFNSIHSKTLYRIYLGSSFINLHHPCFYSKCSSIDVRPVATGRGLFCAPKEFRIARSLRRALRGEKDKRREKNKRECGEEALWQRQNEKRERAARHSFSQIFVCCVFSALN